MFLMLVLVVLVVLVAGVSPAVAQESGLSEKQKSQLIKRFPKSDANKDGKLDDAELRALRNFFQARRKDKWWTVGFRQGNTMGGGKAAISKGGKFRGFVLAVLS